MHTLVLIAMMSVLMIVAPAAAQDSGKWVKRAVFPEPSEELVGASADGKFYVFGGLGPGWIPQGLAYEYDPETDKWTKKKPMALSAHHVAFTELNGKFYAFGGFVAPESGPPAWVPNNNAWQYDPPTDSWKAVTPMPKKRGSAVAATVNGKIYVIGGATVHPGSSEPALHPTRPHRSVGTVEEYDPKTNTWSERSSMPTARNHAAIGVVNNKIYVIGGRLGSAFIFTASNTNVVEEYDPATDQWGLVKSRMPTEQRGCVGCLQRADLRGRRRTSGRPSDGCVSRVRSVQPGNQYLVGTPNDADAQTRAGRRCRWRSSLSGEWGYPVSRHHRHASGDRVP